MFKHFKTFSEPVTDFPRNLFVLTFNGVKKNMRKIIVLSFITLDGVLQGPGRPEEDTSGGFKYGGWIAPYGDEVGDLVVQKELKQPADYLLGRKTFEIWAPFWPKHADIWSGINDGTKYVLSKTMKKSGWKNTIFIESLEDIKKLKNSEGSDFQVWGSSRLVQLLLKNDLVDELRLKIYPVTLGTGKKLFDNGTIPAAFTLTKSLATPAGVIIANYKRAGDVKTGTGGA
jgi:dihydrofolate reductase